MWWCDDEEDCLEEARLVFEVEFVFEAVVVGGDRAPKTMRNVSYVSISERH
jgi:hypothetical protein